MTNKIRERDINNFLNSNFSKFHHFISNVEEFENNLESGKEQIYKSTDSILISDLIKLIIIDKVSLVTSDVESYKLIGQEFKLLPSTNGRGKQPSIDLLAYNNPYGTLALIELKISNSSEREAVTELSAYTQGLQNRFHGLSNLDVIWMPISTDWRTTLKSAIENAIIWNNVLALPLKLTIDQKADGTFDNLSFEIINLTKDLKEDDYRNLFSYECFDAFDYYTEKELGDRKGFINYITSIFTKQNINGFIVFHKNVADEPFPNGFTICIFNPYKGHLHKKILNDIVKDDPDFSYESVNKNGGIINEMVDVDFFTDEVKELTREEADFDGSPLNWGSNWVKDFLSVGDFTFREDDLKIKYAIKFLEESIDSVIENNRAFGTPDFKIWFQRLNEDTCTSVMYFGLHNDLMAKKIQIEHKRGIHKEDFFDCLSSFTYLKSTFEQFN